MTPLNRKQEHRNKWDSIESAKNSNAPQRAATRSISLESTLVRQLKKEARACAPREACGVLIGPDLREIDPTQSEQIKSWIRIPNVARQLDRFTFDPFSYAQTERSVRLQGRSIIGIYHSHLSAPPRPSPTDEDAARQLWGHETSWLYLILGCEKLMDFQVAAWRLVAGSLQRIPLDSSTTALGSSFSE